MSIETAMTGKVLTGYELGPMGEWITLHFEGDQYLKLDAEGDCCSHSWIESIDQPDHLQGRVLHVEHINMPDLGQCPSNKHEIDEYSVLQYYGLKIVTERGHVVIDYRNDSNGYYGGSLEIGDNNMNVDRYDD